MTRMPAFEYARPESLEQALELLAATGSRVLAGGTDLLPKLGKGALQAERLVSLSRLSELDHLVWRPAEGLTIGATVRISDVGRHPEVRRHYPALAEACTVMATPQIRNMGTLAGNLVNGAPCADTAGPLLSGDAVLTLISRNGRREVSLATFFKGPGEVDLAQGELLESVFLPAPPERTGAGYRRISARSQVDMAAASVSARLTLAADGSVQQARLALGAVAPTPLRCREAEALLEGRPPEARHLAAAAASCEAAASPIDDVRASAAWRREVVRVLTSRALEQALAAARGETR